MKLIFLDIDGVLNSNFTDKYTKSGSLFVDDDKILLLKRLIDQTGAKVVLSSTWRVGWSHLELCVQSQLMHDFIELREKLWEHGVELHDRTTILDAFMRRRGEEIQAYLDNHEDIEGYVILDDLNGKYLRPCSSHLVQTSEWRGLEEKHIKKAKAILESEV